ncbi:AraC family transcriptional regulator [Allorhizobium borbori]|uniref:AraC-like DNA-binding protein n=1 Tax=Allorhizobium borbori TaxID=485907 RepID=A0A7W6JYC9_9HYPH|nr:AraC family transcriptional regulator [Allorhizobium borbori]MBB4101834.1 AraC-like DNA-binding protein [Allorhizobium borbori]PZU20201.1 MAG: AraC family transcriptional regulator [Shinella sp.]
MTNSPELEGMTIIAGVASAVAEHAASYGIDIKPICEALGIDPEMLQSMTARVSLDKICRLLEACALLSGDEAFGLKCVDAYERGASGPFGYGLIVAPTVRDLVDFLEAHVPGATSSSYFVREETEKGVVLRLTFSPLVVKRDQYVDMATTMVMARLRDIVGERAALVEIELERPKPRNPAIFQRYLSNRLTFSSRINSVCFPHEIMGVVNPRGDQRLFTLMDMQCRSLHPSKPASQEEFVTEVRDYLHLRIAEPELSLTETAKHFDLSERTLQRRLSEQGTSLNDIRDAIRRDMSLTLLKESDLSIAEICYRLGYSAPSAFSRSVTRWFGTSPRAVRNRKAR